MQLLRDIKAFEGEFDILIVGGGIHGACLARVAARQRLRVALIDRGDFGAATSRNSLKLVHGGIRYLQHLDLRRMRESIRAQRAWRIAAPHLVRPLRCVIPTYGMGSRGPLALAAGMIAYGLVGFDRNRRVRNQCILPHGGVIRRRSLQADFPELMQEGVTGGAYWYDAQLCDPPRLTYLCIADACAAEAVAANHVVAKRLLCSRSRVTGVLAEDRLAGRDFEIRAKVTVNAAGPWIDGLVAGARTPARPAGLSWTRNINLVVPRLFADEIARGVSSQRRSDSAIGESKRLFFVTPWRDCSIIGTAHDRYSGDPDAVSVSSGEIAALLDEFRKALPHAKVEIGDIRSVHLGLTPSEEDVRERAKRATVVDHWQRDGLRGLISVAGIKYTTAPTLAQKLATMASRMAGVRLALPDVDVFETPLPDAPNAADSEIAIPPGLDAEEPDLVWARKVYGKHSSAMLNLLCKGDASTAEHVFRCRVAYAAANEMAVRLRDVILRATDNAERGCLSASQFDWAADYMARHYKWSPEQRRREIDDVRGSVTGSPAWSAGERKYDLVS